MNEIFTKNIDELVSFFGIQKYNIVRFIKNNLKENIHYIKKQTSVKKGNNGGHNEIIFYTTEETFTLIKNSYNLKNRYIKKINENFEHVNVIMCNETKTIGFIENSYNGVFLTKRQKHIGKYYVDLYFEQHNLAVECDENNHIYRDTAIELEREQFILSKNISIIRFNPNHIEFDLSIVLREINKFLFLKSGNNAMVINVIFSDVALQNQFV